VGNPDAETMRGVAAECVNLVGEQFGRQLDWSIASLGELDEVCAELTADGPLTGQRFELWWQEPGLVRPGAARHRRAFTAAEAGVTA